MSVDDPFKGTPFAPVNRRGLTPRKRLEVWQVHRGRCHICGGKINSATEKWDVEHRISLENGGADHIGNMAPAHVKCHREKTSEDRATAAKSRRVYAKHNGLHRPRAVMPGSRASRWKRKMDGTTVRRDSE